MILKMDIYTIILVILVLILGLLNILYILDFNVLLIMRLKIKGLSLKECLKTDRRFYRM